MVGGIGNDLENTWRSPDSESLRLPLTAIIAIALATGITIAWHAPVLAARTPWPWLIASASFLLLAIGSRWIRRSASAAKLRTTHTTSIALICLAIVAFGMAWISIRHHRTHPDDLASQLGEEAALVTVSGVALTSPAVRTPIGGALARFDYREPATYFPMRVESLIDRFGTSHAARGEVLVRIDQTIQPFRAGSHVEATGFLLRPQPPRNPGEFDFSQYARSLGQAGFLTVRQRDLLKVTPADRPNMYEWFLTWRDELRRRSAAWLLSDLPATQHAERNALLASIMLGLRDEKIDDVYNSFQRVGLAHVLAISGFHLGILAAFVLLIARGLGGGRFIQGCAVIVFVALYLLMVEARMPVLRAGVMTVMACVGLMIGRRINVSGMLWFSAIVLLLWRPDQLFDPGFQLTFGVVLGLLQFTRTVERRMPFRAALDTGSSASMLWQWTRTATATAITAWIIAMPIVIYHFGMISPLAALLSVITLPLATIILAIGFLKMAIAAVLPSAALVLGVPLAISADVLLSIVMTFDAMPLTVLHVPVPPPWWTAAAMTCAIWLLAGDRWFFPVIERLRVRRLELSNIHSGASSPTYFPSHRRVHYVWAAKWLLAAILIAVLLWPPKPIEGLRIDMLSVGDGSCYIIRSCDSAVLFDAGSSTDLNIARKSIVPALRHLNVRAIDALIVSHADMDHYSAALELVDDFAIREAFMTPQLFAEAQADPLGPVAFMLEQLGSKRVVVRPAVAGDIKTFGDARWTWLHPHPQQGHERSNDDSTVVRIECGGRVALMCGDIQHDAMTQLLRAADENRISLSADVMELPHHGSFHETAERFVRHVNPSTVMQSTGWSRWRQDKWRDSLAGIERLVTARDGACSVHLHSNGECDVRRFVESTMDAASDE